MLLRSWVLALSQLLAPPPHLANASSTRRRRQARAYGLAPVPAECLEPRIVLTAPTFDVSSYAFTIDEDPGMVTSVAPIGSVYAADASGYYIDDPRFSIDCSGLIYRVTLLDFESFATCANVFTCVVTASASVYDDNGVMQLVEATVPVTITVNDVDEAPTFGAPADAVAGWNFTISEMAALQDDVGTIPVSDPQSDALFFTVYERDRNPDGTLVVPATWTFTDKFVANQVGNNMLIEVASESIDFESHSEHILRIEASDGMDHGDVIVTITLDDEDEWDSGAGLFLGTRPVLQSTGIGPPLNTGASHTAVIIIPTDQDSWKSDPRFNQTIYVMRRLMHYTILSAEKGGVVTDENPLGFLTRYPNGESILPFASLGTIGFSLPEFNAIETLLGIHSLYDDDVPYKLIPNGAEQRYNSNSYCHGLLIQFANIDGCVGYPTGFAVPVTGTLGNSHPGWDLPLPEEFFDV